MLARLHAFIRNALKARRAGIVQPSFITEAINAASKDLWLELVEKNKRGVSSPLLEPFKASSDLEINSGSGTISDWAGYEVVSAHLDDTPVIVAKTDEQWTSQIIPEGEHIDHFIEDIDVSSGSATLPETFVKAISVNEGNYQGVIVPPDQFYSKDLLATFNEDIKDPNQLIHNLETATIAGNALPHTLDNDFVFPAGVFVETASGVKRQGYLVSPDVFFAKNIHGILELEEKGKNTSSHPLASPFNTHQPLPVSEIKQKLLVRETYGSPSYLETIPDDYMDHVGVFYFVNGDGTFEGQILDHDEFLDRVNSAIVPPTAESPVATIHDNKLDVYPKSGATSIILPYRKDHDNSELPIFTIHNNQLLSRESLQADDSVVFSFYKHPTGRRPIATIKGFTATVRPSSSTAKITVVSYPSLKRPMIRSYDNGSDKAFDAKPSAFSDTIKIYGLTPPTNAAATYGVSSSGDPTLTVSQDLDWRDDAFSHIASRALFYLGHNTGDQQAINLEAQKEGIERGNN